MLVNKKEIVEKLQAFDDAFGNSQLDCWVKNEGDFDLYIFSFYAINQTELADSWKNFNDLIALHFQSKLNKSVERWNLYLVFIVQDKVYTELKYEIEQDKYATRKLVIDEVQNPLKVDELITNKLFAIDIGSSKSEAFSQDGVLDLIKKRDALLYDLIKNKDAKPKDIFQKYIEVGK